MTKKILSFGALGLLVMTQTGCPSFSTFGLARTLNKGAIQGWVAPGGGGAIALGNKTGTTVGAGYPLLEGGVRVGVTDHVEVGGRLGFNGITGEGKFALIRSETTDSGFNLSLNPGVGFIGYGGSAGSGSSGGGGFYGVLTFHLPVLMGIDFGGHELVIGPRAIDQVLFGSFSSGSGSASSVANVFYAGGSVGFAIKVSGGFRIMPEIAIGVPVVTSVDNLNSSVFGGMIFQGGVGFLFGSSNQYDPPAPPPTVNAPPPTVAAPPPGG